MNNYNSTNLIRKNDMMEARNFIVINVGYAQTIHHWGYTDLSSPFVRIFYVVDGTATLHLPTGDVVATSGHMYMVPPFVSHSYDCDPGFKFYYLFAFERFHEKVDIFEEHEFPLQVKANEAADLLFRNFCQLYPNLSLPYEDAEAFSSHRSYLQYTEAYATLEPYEHLQLQGLVWIIFSYFMKHSVAKREVTDERVIKATNYVQRHIGEEISLDDLADIACVSKMHLARLFRQYFSVPPLQFIIRKKVQYAQELLLTTGLSVQLVASRVGIEDASYFIRLFKKNIGFTPQEYREKLQ